MNSDVLLGSCGMGALGAEVLGILANSGGATLGMTGVGTLDAVDGEDFLIGFVWLTAGGTEGREAFSEDSRDFSW
ncbi:MAG: hypothetical protein KC545_06960 [Nitrospira sp.]|nr:hypothetical protein [Nitrospira sp.]